MVLRLPTDPPGVKFLFPVMVFDFVTPRGFPGLALVTTATERKTKGAPVSRGSTRTAPGNGFVKSDRTVPESRGVMFTEFFAAGLVAALAELILAVFSLIVAESTVFCRLKLLAVVWLWFVVFDGVAGEPPAMPTFFHH